MFTNGIERKNESIMKIEKYKPDLSAPAMEISVFEEASPSNKCFGG